MPWCPEKRCSDRCAKGGRLNPDLAHFLSHHHPVAQHLVFWGKGAIQLHVAAYLTDEPPPREHVTSVRAVVLRGTTVLVLRNEDSYHILPGGRREDDETFKETLRREVLEESGWEVHPVSILGFLHYHHIRPERQEYRFDHDDFLQVVYTAQAVEEVPGARIADDYEIEAVFRPHAEARSLLSDSTERVFLGAALARFKSG